MTTTEVFFFVVLPATLVCAGWIAVRLNERSGRREHMRPRE